MRRIILIIIACIVAISSNVYAAEKYQNYGDTNMVQGDFEYIELQSGTDGKFVYIKDKDVISEFQELFNSLEYKKASVEELNSTVGGFRYVITFYDSSGNGYRFNKEKDYITAGSFSNIDSVVKLEEKMIKN